MMKKDSTFEAKNIEQQDTLLADLLAIFRQNKLWYILSLVAMLALGFLYIKCTPPVYKRMATVLVSDDSASGGMSEVAAFQEFFNSGTSSVHNQIGLFESKSFMAEVVERLGLDISYSLDEPFRPQNLYGISPVEVKFVDLAPSQKLEFSVIMLDYQTVAIEDLEAGDLKIEGRFELAMGEILETPVGGIVVLPTAFMSDDYLAETIIVERRAPRAVTTEYNNKLKVALFDNMSTLINLSIEDESIARAEDILNTLIEVYQDYAVEDKNLVLAGTMRFVDERLAIIEADLREVDAQIESFKKDNGLTDIASESNMYLASYSRLDEQGLNVENQLSIAEFMRSYLADEQRIDELIPANIGLSDAGLQAQIADYNALVMQRNRLRENSSSSNPLVVELTVSIAFLREAIAEAVENLIASLTIQAAAFEARAIANSSRIADVPTQQKYVVSIQRQQKIKEELYLYLLNKREESQLQQSVNQSNCRIVDAAHGADLPVAPNQAKVLIVCLVFGFAVPSSLLYMQSVFDTSVTTRSDIKGAVSIPFLGDIPLDKKVGANNILVRSGSRDATSEAFKIVRHNIDFMVGTPLSRGRIIQLTSFNSGSGKTFVTTNLAASIALGGSRVVVVDLDIRKASLTKKLSLGSHQIGASQYLSGQLDDLEQIIHPIGEGAAFDLVPSGALPPNPVELLKGERLAQLLDGLSGRYDYVLVDNPPYAAVVDASICARACDQTIYIIRSGLFDKRLLPELEDLYNSQQLNHMGLLLNGVDYAKINYGYGYGYANEENGGRRSFLRRS